LPIVGSYLNIYQANFGSSTIPFMNELKQLESLGLVLPSPAYIFGAILFGIIGWIAFRRGKKASIAGIATLPFPHWFGRPSVGVCFRALVQVQSCHLCHVN
jgi:hypothetical protein